MKYELVDNWLGYSPFRRIYRYKKRSWSNKDSLYQTLRVKKMLEKRYNYFIWKKFPFGIIEDIRG